MHTFQLTRAHFLSLHHPREIQRYLQLLQELDTTLKGVLREELAFGNLINQVEVGQSGENSITVSLIHPFHKKYELPHVIYQELDVHEGRECYRSMSSTNQIIN